MQWRWDPNPGHLTTEIVLNHSTMLAKNSKDGETGRCETCLGNACTGADGLWGMLVIKMRKYLVVEMEQI